MRPLGVPSVACPPRPRPGGLRPSAGILDSSRGFEFVQLSRSQVRALGEKIGSMGRDGEGQRFLALAVSKFRAENCFALGMGLGALYALIFDTDVAVRRVVHLMQAGWGVSVALANAQNAGLLLHLPGGSPAESTLRVGAQRLLRPFVAITGVQALMHVAAFALSVSPAAPEEAAPSLLSRSF